MRARRVPRREATATMLLAAAGAACGWTRSTAPAATLSNIAERYVRLTLRLAQHQPSLVEAWLGPAEWRPGPRQPVAPLLEEVMALRAALAQVRPAGDQRGHVRATYLDRQLAGLQTAAQRLAGETMRFEVETNAAFGLDRAAWQADADRALEEARETLERHAPGRGSLPDRLAEFRRRHALSPGSVAAAVRAAVEVCRTLAARVMTLPHGDAVDVEVAVAFGFEAQAVYQGGLRTHLRLDVNGGPDVARAVWLAAHETYGGHHVQHVLAERDLLGNDTWHERQLHPAFGSHLLLSEGAAEAGADLLLSGDAYADVCREVAASARTSHSEIGALVAVQRALPVLATQIPPIAEAYLDGDLSTHAAVERLRTDALSPDPAGLLAVIERQRVRLLAYPVGRRLAEQIVGQGSASERGPRLQRLSTLLIDDR